MPPLPRRIQRLLRGGRATCRRGRLRANAPVPAGKARGWIGALLAWPLLAHAGGADGRLINLSVRAQLASPEDALVAGFVLSGSGDKSILIRGIGPALGGFGVPSPLTDPVLSLNAGTTPLRSNDNWNDSPDAAQLTAASAAAGAFALPVASRDAAILALLAAGNYTARVVGKTNAAGDALLELYDRASDADPRLVNISALARVGGSSGTLTAGFVIGGGWPRRVLIRGIGPSLGQLGVDAALGDPQIAVFPQGAAQPSLRNDNWGGTDALKNAFAAAGAFSLTANTSRDAALIATLEPGAYTVELTGVGAATGVALIEIYDVTPPATSAPEIALQPRALTLGAGASASLTVIAASAAAVHYQWQKDGIEIPGATSDTLVLPALKASDAGAYRVAVANAAGSAMSAPAAITVLSPPGALPPASTFELVGFATNGAGTTGGGVLAPDDPSYLVLDATVANPAQQLRTWLEGTTPLVVDIRTDVNLGALNNVFARPRTNPELMASGVGVINVRSNKTIFSSTGATVRHGTFNLSGQSNIIIRNLRFRGLWEFDEGSQNPPDNAPWGYKIQDWDYIDVQNNARNVWIDHCDFEKSYDGLLDAKLGADLITVSWCRFGGDTEGAVERQVAYLEKLYQGELSDSRVSYAFYQGLREGAYATQGIPRQTVAGIVAHERPHDKGNLIGAADNETVSIGCLNVTFHHIYYHDCRQRLPRMRFGNAHVFDLFVDNSGIAEGTNQGTATTCGAAVFAENNTYFEIAVPLPSASGTSPPGRITQSGSVWIWRGIETSLSSEPFLQDPAAWIWNTGTRNFTWLVAPPPNARALPYSYVADPADYTRTHLDSVGVIVPTSAAGQATLAAYLVRTRAQN